jgi:hypothetical protein
MPPVIDGTVSPLATNAGTVTFLRFSAPTDPPPAELPRGPPKLQNEPKCAPGDR